MECYVGGDDRQGAHLNLAVQFPFAEDHTWHLLVYHVTAFHVVHTHIIRPRTIV